MNEWERERRRMERYKELYPPGTRIMLLSMGSDEKCPIEGGARGTVLNVSVGGIDVAWDNGRGSSLIPGKDSFRTLTESELAQEARLKNGKVADFGDDCQIVIPNEPIDCSKLGYFDELESDCWELVKGYLAKLGIELVANEDGVEPIIHVSGAELPSAVDHIEKYPHTGLPALLVDILDLGIHRLIVHTRNASYQIL